MKFQIGAMTVGDILDRGLKIMLSRLGVFYTINFCVLIPLIVLSLVAPEVIENTQNPFLALPLVLCSLLLLLILQPIGTAAILHVIHQEYVGRRVTLGQAVSFALSRFGSILGTSILAGLIIMVGFALCFIPGIIFWLNYCLFAQIVVVEGLSGWQALTRSKELVYGWRTRVLGILMLIGLSNYAIVAAGGLLELVLPSHIKIQTAGGLEIQQLNFVNNSIKVLLTQSLQILTATYAAVCTTLIYFDLRVRKEGYDLELSAKQEAEPAEVV